MLGRMGPEHGNTSVFTTEPSGCDAAGQYPDASIHAVAYTPLAGLLVHTNPACTFWQRTAQHTDTGGVAVHWRDKSELHNKKRHVWEQGGGGGQGRGTDGRGRGGPAEQERVSEERGRGEGSQSDS